jgi:UDP-4-amino-4,6-dideoxy-N-acetyl-beta-L-altrosamine N-acetyltransferase
LASVPIKIPEMTSLHSGKIVNLKPVEEDHIELIRKWRNAQHVTSGMIWRETITSEAQSTWLKKISKGPNSAYFVILEKEGGEPVGVVDIKKINHLHRHGEWGIFLGETSHRWKGIATEAACLLLHYSFQELGLHKVKATLIAENIASIRFHEALGFQIKGHLKDEACIKGLFHDVLLGGLLQKDFYHSRRSRKVLQDAGIALQV